MIAAGLLLTLISSGCPFSGPTADFSAIPTEGDAPMSVRFSDESTPGSAPIETWQWDFGDGSRSSEKNPVHIYTRYGTYRVTLTVSTLMGTSTETKNAFITVRAAPVASFSASPRTGTSPLSVQFLDESEGGPFPITARQWSFGDGETSQEKDPRHSYTQPGAYTVSLTVTSGGGTTTETRQEYVRVGSLPAPSFRASPTSGRAPLDVQFTDTSNAGDSPISSWSWNFGDGATSTEQNPEHRYEAPGNYTVRLTTRNASGEATSTRTNLIRATAGPVAAFRATPLQGAAPLTVVFTDESSAGSSAIQSWLWDFGDGTSSTERNPTHAFPNAGQYTISLTVETEAGSDAEVKQRYITALAPPVANFTGTPLRGPAPLSVEFRDLSTPGAAAISTRQWSFGDSAVSGETNPVHVYTAPGRYPVSLIVETSVGSDRLTREQYVEVIALPVASFEASVTSGQRPLTVQFTDTSEPGTQPITSWLWDFGDGTTSAEPNPTRVYTATGEYTVKLTVATAEGQHTSTRSQYIRVFERADADFTASPLSGPAPLAVQFRDDSSPGSVGISSRSWDFGDGNTSGLEDPLHTYATPGTYTVSMTLGTPVGPVSERKTGLIRVEPVAGFTRAPSNGLAPLTVAFTDTTATAPLTATARAWDFGDGGTSTAANPSHTYAKAGTYDVRLTVTTEQGDVSTLQAGSVQVRPRPEFTGTPLSAVGAPLEVQFEDKTDPGSLTITAWDWNFGDGSHSTNQNPTHQFTQPGIYDVSLTVTTALGNSTTVKQDLVVVRPAAAFTAAPTTGTGSLTVQFTDQTSTGLLSIQTWAWDFGDGTTSRLRNPSHTYSAPGTYTVTLSVTGAQGTDTETKTGLITVRPNVQFQGNFTTGTAPLAVTFTDSTKPGALEISKRVWNFGVGDPSEEVAPVFTYTDAGLYDVSLTLTTAQGAITGTRNDYIAVRPAFAISPAVTPGTGTSSVVFTNTTAPGNLTGIGWLWNFGDGTTSTEAGPTHVFDEPGIYPVTLTMTSAEGVTTTGTITTVNVAPVPSLTATPDSGVAPLQVQFADTSEIGSLTVTGRLWTFGDGTTSSDAAPLHTYTTAGTYQATLRITTALGNHTSAVPEVVEVSPEPNFTGIPREGAAPLAVIFANTSNTGGATVTGTNWDFGDGNSSTSATPTHTYTVPGTYTVSFVLTTTEGVESTTKTDYIKVNPVPAFTASATSGDAPFTVDFTNTTVLGNVTPTAYAWTFGDGGTSTDENPSHTYNAPGNYAVRLSITSIQGTVSTLQAGLITVAPDVTFDASATGGAAPISIAFTDTTALGNLDVDEWIWNFGDGTPPVTTQTGATSHAYTVPGTYTPALTLVTAQGNFSGNAASPVVINPVPAFSADLRSGPGALTVVFSDDTDTGTVTTSNRVWSWGDGTPNTTTNNATVSHTYAAPGTYNVTMTINTLTQGALSRTETGFIVVNPLTFNLTGGFSGNVPHNISVNNTTATGDLAISGTQWDYGDGTGQTASTSHTYNAPGNYIITMIAATTQGNRTLVSSTPVVVSPVLSVSADVTSGPAVVDVTFTDNTVIGGVSVSSRTWNFGDGDSVTIPAPTATVVHEYTNSGTTSVVRQATMTLNTSLGSFTTPSTTNITIHPINFSSDITTAEAPATVNFTDVTVPGALTIASRSWNFRDGGTALTVGNTTSRNYTAAGLYDVELTITTSQGNTATASLATPVLIRPDVQYQETSALEGPAPWSINVEDLTNPGNLTNVSRVWTWGDGTTSTVAGATTSHTYTAAGCYTATMALVSNEGTFTDNSQAFEVVVDHSGTLVPNTTGNNSQAGIMFDLQPKRAMRILGFTVNFSSSGTSNSVRRWVNLGSSYGLEATFANWTSSEDITVTSGSSIFLDYSDFAMANGQRRGFFLLNRSYNSTSTTIRYQTANPANTHSIVENADLYLITNCGKAIGSANDFDGQTFNFRWFVGTVHYAYDVVCNKRGGGLALGAKQADLDLTGETTVNVSVEDEVAATALTDGGWAAIGHHGIDGGSSNGSLLIRTDSAMDLLWERELSDLAFESIDGIHPLQSGALLLSGPTTLDGAAATLLVKIDAEGDVVWMQILEDCPASGVSAIVESPEGDLSILATSPDSTAAATPLLYRLDASSNVLWSVALPAAPSTVGWGLAHRGDGLTSVYGSLDGDGQDTAIWEVLVDETGAVAGRSGIE